MTWAVGRSRGLGFPSSAHPGEPAPPATGQAESTDALDHPRGTRGSVAAWPRGQHRWRPDSPAAGRGSDRVHRPDAERAPDGLIGIAGVGVLLAVGIAQAGDLVTFIQMIAVRGPGAEANPIVAHVLASLGLPALVLLKVGLVAMVAVTFAIVVKRHQWVAAFVATLATVVG